MSPWKVLPLLLLCLAWSVPVGAVEGATEINQTSVEAAGGFPLVISARGRYALTSDLIVPANKQAILVQASDVYIDLRGFQIVGPFTCSVAGCPAGTVNGISGQEGSGRNITVKNGAVRGFSGTCLSLLGQSYVSEVFVSRCGQIGIQLSQGSLVRASRVTDTGRQGIQLLGDEVGYADNVVYLTGLNVSKSSSESVGIDGGTALGPNVCLRGACTPRGRRYYLTVQNYNGAQAAVPGNCEPGFHFASVYEILDPTQLSYDSGRGKTLTDQGDGPVSGSKGWVRTGNVAVGASPLAGYANCDGWKTSSSSKFGTAVALGTSIGGGPNFPVGTWEDDLRSPVFPWIGGSVTCFSGIPIWCVEDQ